MFYCYKYDVYGASAILSLFEQSSVEFILRKYFVTRTLCTSTLRQIPTPAVFVGDDILHQRAINLHWLACDASSTRHHAFHIIWWPSLLPISKMGKLVFNFNYVSNDDGVNIHGNLPVRPVVPQNPPPCPIWRIKQSDSQSPLKMHFVKLA